MRSLGLVFVLCVVACGDDDTPGGSGGVSAGGAAGSGASGGSAASGGATTGGTGGSSGAAGGGTGGSAAAASTAIRHRVAATPADDLIVAGRVSSGGEFFGPVQLTRPVGLVLAKLDPAASRK